MNCDSSVKKLDPSPLPHWKLYGTNVSSTSSQIKLTQSVYHSFWVNVAIMIAYRSKSGFNGSNVTITQVGKMNSPVLTWRLYSQTFPSRTVGNPSSISQTTDKTLYGGNIHTKLQINLLLPLTMH